MDRVRQALPRVQERVRKASLRVQLAFPWLIILYFLLTSWAVIWEQAVRGMIVPAIYSHALLEPEGALAGGIVLLAVLIPVRLLWLSAWVLAILRGPKWFPRTRPDHQMDTKKMNSVMQSSVGWCVHRTSAPFEEVREFWEPTSRPRYCDKCLDTGVQTNLRDRVYHCSELGQHIPLYDHYCGWTWIVVYLDTIKPFLVTLLFLTLDTGICLGSGLYAVAERSLRDLTYCWVALIFLYAGIMGALGYHFFYRQWRNFVLNNEVYPERGVLKRRFQFAVTVAGVEPSPGAPVVYSEYTGNPWDLGSKRNRKQVIGPLWMFPLFWVPSPMVRAYYSREGCSPSGSDFLLNAYFEAQVRAKLEAGLRDLPTEFAGFDEERFAYAKAWLDWHPDR